MRVATPHDKTGDVGNVIGVKVRQNEVAVARVGKILQPPHGTIADIHNDGTVPCGLQEVARGG